LALPIVRLSAKMSFADIFFTYCWLQLDCRQIILYR
jgi:hypothetical protein